MRAVAAAWLSAALGVTGCGDATDPSREASADPPAVFIADLPLGFEFGSEAPVALEAQQVANDLLYSLWPEAGLAHTIFFPTTLGTWARDEEGCWVCSQDWRPVYPKRLLCTACPAEEGYAWDFQRQEFDAAGDLLYSHRGAGGTTCADGLCGEFSYFDSEAPFAILVSWTWVAAGDRRSASYAFYLGPVDPLSYDASMEWEIDGEAMRHWLWTWPADERIEFALDEGGAFGWLRDERWSSGLGAWRLAHEMTWAGGRGTWVLYDAQGGSLGERSW